MKKQYLIIGLAGLMASNAVSTSYANRELDVYLGQCGLSQDSSPEKPGFYARHSTLIKTVGGIALAGTLGVMCYKLNKSGKLNPDAVKATLKSLVSKAGDLKSKIGSKMSSLFSRSSNSVNNTFVNKTMTNSTMCDANGNKPQEIVWPKFDSKPVIEIKPVVAPVEHKSLGARFGSWFSSLSKPETGGNISLFNKNRIKIQEVAKNVPSPIHGYFVPNAETPKTFIIKKPSVNVQNGGSAFDTYMEKHTEVLNAAKKNIYSFFKRPIKRLSATKDSVSFVLRGLLGN